ncbi:hypothetical protein N7495_004088 [Penicillium taxi]|uniref:uncharacterized protein n=1 Tax=Penicillium taxi TaxID=168475 RepID=UPI0025457CC7|nr:uncharacterized protein N7495_004088 [Penicillium taxi]KAJ5899344.1 hypothetical protein N7495_004088 [Penicillium taxi]
MHTPSEIITASETPATSWTFLELFDKNVEDNPTALAIACLHQPEDLYGFSSIPLKSEERPYLRWSYHTLKQASKSLLAGLLRLGASPGTPIVVLCRNQAEYVISMLAAYRLGLVFIPMTPDTLAQPTDLQQMLNKVVKHCNVSEIFFLSDNADNLGKVPAGLQANIKCELFSNVIASEQALDVPEQIQGEKNLFFTSGTSNTPKGCYLDASILLKTYEPSAGLSTATPEDRIIVTGPGHHLYGYICIAITLLKGAGLIFAGAKYSPESVIRAASDETCNFIAMVPSMIHSILGMLEQGSETLKIKGIISAGMVIAPSLLENLRGRLGYPWVENLYGMTEGVLVTTGIIHDTESILSDGYLAAGKPVKGSMIRICHPETGELVSQGTPGQLFFSGPALISGYICQPEPEVFVERDGHHWINTGDEAFIGKNDMIYIIGRYKDIIMRGGENLSMAKLENLLAEIPELSTLQPQVVAAEDTVAGEVPVLIIKTKTSHEAVQQLKDTIRTRLGSDYVPRDVFSLDDLGLSTLPLTTTGKTNKRQLKQIVKDFTESQDKKELDSTLLSSDLAKTVTVVWSRLLGTEASRLNIETPLSQVADSMLLVSARDRVRKITGHSVDLPSWIAAETIHDQIKLLATSTLGPPPSNPNGLVQVTRTGPPQASDIVHLGGDVSGFRSLKREVEELIRQDGFDWEDVQDIVPCTDWIQSLAHSKVVDSWNIRTSIVSMKSSMIEVREALEATLLNNPLMLSYLISNTGIGENLGLHVIMRQTKKMLDQCITDYGTVRTVADAKLLADEYIPKYHPQLPVSHSIADATSIGFFNEDLDQALSGKLSPHVPYKLWADSYHSLRNSPQAEAAIRYHVNQLTDLREHYNVIWPSPTPEVTITPERKPHNGHMLSFSAPSLYALQRKSGVTQPMILQAALAFVAMAHTKHSHAFFINLQAGRSSFPFLPEHSSLASVEASDIAGPTFNGALVLTTIQPGETVVQYLQRMQAAQDGFTKYPSVPWNEVFRRLGLSSSQIIPAVANTLLFNWLPGLPAQILGGNPFKNSEQECRFRFRTGLGAGVGTGGPDGSQVVFWFQGALANTSTAQTELVAEMWKQSALWVTNEENWNRPAIEAVELLKKALE